jgi:hypothetical protein
VSQPASTTLAASATEAKIARASELTVKTNPTTFRARLENPNREPGQTDEARSASAVFRRPCSEPYALKPLIKILTSG